MYESPGGHLNAYKLEHSIFYQIACARSEDSGLHVQDTLWVFKDQNHIQADQS